MATPQQQAAQPQAAVPATVVPAQQAQAAQVNATAAAPQPVGCLNPANVQCDPQCETCQPNGQCAPRQGACGAGPNRWWAGTCQAGRCVVSA